jgi:hypothetical protein
LIIVFLKLMDICSRATLPPMNSSKRYPPYWKTISPSRKMQNHIRILPGVPMILGGMLYYAPFLFTIA